MSLYVESYEYVKVYSGNAQKFPMLGEVKTENGQTHVHATVLRRTYMRPLSVGLTAELAVKPSFVEMMATLAVTETGTLFLVHNSL